MKKKIVIVISELYLGGTEKHIYNIVKKLSQNKKLDFLILTLTAKGDYYNQFLSIDNINVHNISNKKKLYNYKFTKFLYILSIMYKTYFFLKKYNPQIVHFFLPTSYLIAGFPSILLRKVKLLMSRRSLNLYQKKYFFASSLEKILHSRMSFVLSNCNEISNQLIKEGVDKNKLLVIKNGIEINHNIPIKLINENSKINFLFLANFIPYKGHIFLIDVVKKIDKRILQNLHFYLVGKKNKHTLQIYNKIKKNNLNEYFTICEQTIDVSYYLEKCHVGISVSKEEGMSNSILEYMNYQMPVIGTDVGGTPELIINNFNGLLIQKDSENDLIKAINFYIINRERINIHGSNSKKILNKNFNIDQCVESYSNLYNSL